MVPISPIKPVTKLDRINSQDLFYAIDTQDYSLKYLHLSGRKLTTNKNYIWYGTKRQFKNICREYGWDALSLINRPK